MTTVVDFVYKNITRELVQNALKYWQCYVIYWLYTYTDVIFTREDPPPTPHTHKLLTINITFTCTQNLINPENSCNNILLMSNWWMRFLLFFFLRRLELVSGKIQCPRPQKQSYRHVHLYQYSPRQQSVSWSLQYTCNSPEVE